MSNLLYLGSVGAPAGTGGSAPSGPAGGSLGGTYPNPTVKQIDGSAGTAPVVATTLAKTVAGQPLAITSADAGVGTSGDLSLITGTGDTAGDIVITANDGTTNGGNVGISAGGGSGSNGNVAISAGPLATPVSTIILDANTPTMQLFVTGKTSGLSSNLTIDGSSNSLDYSSNTQPTGAGGHVQFNAQSSSDNTGGAVALSAGAGATGGAVTVTAGAGTAGIGGGITCATGAGSAGTGGDYTVNSQGNVSINAGLQGSAALSLTNSSGAVNIQSGGAQTIVINASGTLVAVSNNNNPISMTGDNGFFAGTNAGNIGLSSAAQGSFTTGQDLQFVAGGRLFQQSGGGQPWIANASSYYQLTDQNDNLIDSSSGVMAFSSPTGVSITGTTGSAHINVITDSNFDVNADSGSHSYNNGFTAYTAGSSSYTINAAGTAAIQSSGGSGIRLTDFGAGGVVVDTTAMGSAFTANLGGATATWNTGDYIVNAAGVTSIFAGTSMLQSASGVTVINATAGGGVLQVGETGWSATSIQGTSVEVRSFAGNLNLLSGTGSNQSVDITADVGGFVQVSGGTIQVNPSAGGALFIMNSFGAAAVTSGSGQPITLTPDSHLQVNGPITCTSSIDCSSDSVFRHNVGIGASSGSYGGGAGVTFIANATTVPTSNPTGGGILFVQGGALKYRGSSGTVTTLAPA